MKKSLFADNAIIFSILAILFTGLVGSAIGGDRSIIHTDETYKHNGVDLGYENLIEFGVETDKEGIETKATVGFRILSIYRFFRPLKPFDDLPLDDQVARIFSTKTGVYAQNGDEGLQPADKDLGEAIVENAKTADKEDSGALDRGRAVLGNNWQTWLGGAGAAAGGYFLGSQGSKDEESRGKTTNVLNSPGAVVNEFGSGSGSTQNTGTSSFDNEAQ